MREKEYCDSPIFQFLLSTVRFLYIYRYCKYAIKITIKKSLFLRQALSLKVSRMLWILITCLIDNALGTVGRNYMLIYVTVFLL